MHNFYAFRIYLDELKVRRIIRAGRLQGADLENSETGSRKIIWLERDIASYPQWLAYLSWLNNIPRIKDSWLEKLFTKSQKGVGRPLCPL